MQAITRLRGDTLPIIPPTSLNIHIMLSSDILRSTGIRINFLAVSPWMHREAFMTVCSVH